MAIPSGWKIAIAQAAKLLTESIGGFYGWLADIVVNYGGRYLYTYFSYLWTKFVSNLKRKKDQTVAKQTYDKVVADPTSTPEDRANAYQNFINTRN